MSRVALRLLALVAALSLVACEQPAAGPSASTAPTISERSPTPSPSTLPRADESRTITDALTRAGVSVDRVFPSKFDWLFGDAAPRTGTFTGYLDSQQVWADVHFFERTVSDITVCAQQPPSSEWMFTVSVKGQPQTLGNSRGTGAATAPLYFAMSERYFVIASSPRVVSALKSSLGLFDPTC